MRSGNPVVATTLRSKRGQGLARRDPSTARAPAHDLGVDHAEADAFHGAARCIRILIETGAMIASRRPRRAGCAAIWAGALLASHATLPAELPTVASINLCTDQLVLKLAEPRQIVTLSWLSADPDESLLAADAAPHALNYGSAEELLHLAPDVVVAGAYTNAFTRTMLRDLGYTVVDVMPAESIDDIEATLRQVAAAIGRAERGEALIAAMRARVERYRRTRPASPVQAVVVRPGGFTVEAPSLAHELMTLAGLRNLPAEAGLDRWGSLSVETLLRAEPELLIFTRYRGAEPSLANAVLAHPALRALEGRVASAALDSSFWTCGLPDSLDSVDVMRSAATAVRAAVAAP
jgi:iron complex transport system substrate-binding protein